MSRRRQTGVRRWRCPRGATRWVGRSPWGRDRGLFRSTLTAPELAVGAAVAGIATTIAVAATTATVRAIVDRKRRVIVCSLPSLGYPNGSLPALLPIDYGGTTRTDESTTSRSGEPALMPPGRSGLMAPVDPGPDMGIPSRRCSPPPKRRQAHASPGAHSRVRPGRDLRGACDGGAARRHRRIATGAGRCLRPRPGR